MKIFLSDNRTGLTSKGFAALVAVLFILLSGGTSVKAQNADYQLGVRGGVGMATLSGFQNNGLKLGIAAGFYGKYFLSENTSIIADLDYSMGGQQSEKWLSGNRDEIKEYRKYSLHYINLPILYQHYFIDILGVEAGLNFRYCLGGNLKTKIGNEGWHQTNLDHNNFDFGIIFGVYTDNLIPHDDFFVSLRAYFGFLDVVKDVGSNHNVSVQVSVGYTLF